ncbi:MAG TPA: glycosyltransferase family 2 protein [Thermoanaerobaculia bacterium]|nr:glycosyltransferase family 2 protein [Thermoanaerobaculia bacterium]
MLALFLKIVLGLWVLRALNVALSRRLVPHLAPAPRRKDGAPFVSIVVPARDEERAIEAATRSKCLQDDPAFEVVAVDDRSSDGTRGILARLETEFAGVLRVVDGAEPPPDWLGKPHALDEGSKTARATRPDDWLVFSDADVVFEPDLLARALAHAKRERLDFLALLPQMEAHGFGERLMVPTIPAAAFCYLPGWLMNVPSARAFGGGGGVFNLIRRDLFDRIGGHEALKASVVDDVQLGRNARKAGGRTGIALALDSISLRMYHGFPEIAKGLEKNGFFGMLGSIPMAALMLMLFFLEGELAGAVLLGGTLERAMRFAAASRGSAAVAPAFFTFEEISLAAVAFSATFVVRAVCDSRLRLGLLSAALHPIWVAAMTWVFARSTWMNGVLHRNEWRGRVRDARSLRT